MEEANFYHALKIDNDRCIGCTHCMKEIVPDRGYLCGAG